MRGAACTRNEDGTVHSLTNKEVLAHWKIPRSEVGLRTRRLKWLQQAARDRRNSVQFFGALFGPICGQQRSTVNVDGSMSVLAHPWAKRVQQDVDSLIRVSDEARALQELAGPHIVAWLKDPHFREDFVNIDVSIPRASEFSRN
eukprot:7082679-Pyramimonas_sp.AAC.1